MSASDHRAGSTSRRALSSITWPFATGIALGLIATRARRTRMVGDASDEPVIPGATLVGTVMTVPVETARPEDTLPDVAATMARRGIGDVILVDDRDRICGVVTDRDIAIRGVARGTSAGTAAEVASRDVVTVSPDTTIADALRLMAERTVRRLPVAVDGRPVGIVTLGDMAMLREPDSVLARIREAAPRR